MLQRIPEKDRIRLFLIDRKNPRPDVDTPCHIQKKGERHFFMLHFEFQVTVAGKIGILHRLCTIRRVKCPVCTSRLLPSVITDQPVRRISHISNPCLISIFFKSVCIPLSKILQCLRIGQKPLPPEGKSAPQHGKRSPCQHGKLLIFIAACGYPL